jgi:hypothetical protein
MFAPFSDLYFVKDFVCFESHEQFFSNLATVTINGDGAANLDLYLALTAFSSEGSFTCHTYCDTGPPFLKVISERPVILTSECQSLPILNVLGLTRPARAGLELTTSRMLSYGNQYKTSEIDECSLCMPFDLPAILKTPC